MTRKSAPVKNTGGGGYTFADNVAAKFLVDMLSRGFPFEVKAGFPTRLDWEAKDLGWHIDDLLLHLDAAHGQRVMAAVSVKSNAHLNTRGFSRSFVQDAWAQWRGESDNPFNRQRDLLGLAVGSLAITVKDEWREIASQASLTDPARMVARLSTTNPQSNEIQREIFTSIQNGAEDLALPPTEDETAELLARLRVVEWDDRFEGEAVNRCAALTVENTVAVGQELWTRLQGIAKEKRTGGTITLPELVQILRPEFNLKDYPDHQSAWQTLDRLSEDNRSSVRGVVGSGIRFSLDTQQADVKNELSRSGAVAVIGESGAGKSSLIATLLGQSGAYDRVLWFRRGQLAFSSQFDLARSLQLQHDLPTLIRQSTAARSVLVVDGFEQFEGDALERVLELIAAIGEPTTVGWQLIITCQPLPWRDYRSHLLRARSAAIADVQFKGPTFEQIYGELRHVPGMGAVLLRKELRTILSNLATLDQVVRTAKAQPFDVTQTWIGETHVIDWIWNCWIGSEAKKYLRARFLQELGALEGGRTGAALKVGDMRQDQLEAFGEAEKEGLIRVADSSVQFAHDIMGDWARYRMLRDLDDLKAADLIRKNAKIPRWGRAIRIYAQSLAEQNSGLDRWNEALAKFDGTDHDSIMAADFFTDSLTLATNSIVLLEELWRSLIADDGKLLRRILQRLQSTATVAHPVVEEITDPELREAAVRYWRLPNPLYWLSMLYVLRTHTDDVARVALNEATASSVLYLRSLPVGFPGRDDAAALAIALGREVQARLAEYRYYSRAGYQDAYEALLYAAYEYPDEVGQIALELCHRREEPEHAILRGIEADERREEAEQKYLVAHPEELERRKIPVPGAMIHFASPLPPPWPDGPSECISESFVAAVVDTPALSALIATRPKIAAEVLLAVSIEEPKEPDRHQPMLDMGGEGLTESKNGYPPIYFKGAFLNFLHASPTEAIEAMLRLVNFATERWFARRGGDPASTDIPLQLSWEFLIDGHNVCWIGDFQVFHWHRYIGLQGSIVGSALMALEKWLYESIDERTDIAPHVVEILSKSKSLAFAGVLTAVGMYRPSLFNDILRPMLSSAELLIQYPALANDEARGTWQIQLMPWANAGRETVQKIVEWNQMPHRRVDVRETVQRLVCLFPSTMEYLDLRAARWKTRWAKQLANPEGENTQLEFLLAIVNPANYTRKTGPDGNAGYEFRLPDSLINRLQAKRPQAEAELRVIELPSRARNILKGRDALNENDLDKWFIALQEIAERTVDSATIRKYEDDAIAGVLAVLFVKHRDWLHQHPEREAWCLAALRDLKVTPDRRDPHSAPILSSEENAEAFRAEAALMLLEDHNDPWILRAVLDGVTGYFYQSTSFVMYAAYTKRYTLGPRFQELVSVMHLWSAIRHAATIRHSAYAWQEFGQYRDMLFNRLSSGRLKERPVTIERAQLLGCRLTNGAMKRTGRYEWDKLRREQVKTSPRRNHKLELNETHLDLTVFFYAYSFLEDIRSAAPFEARELLDYFRPVFGMQMGTIPTMESGREDGEIERGDSRFEPWLMGIAARFAAKIEDEELARSLYAPILDLGASSQHWVRDFLHAWFEHGLHISSTPERFGVRWGAMVDYALGSPAWQREKSRLYFYLDSLANELIGITGDSSLRVSSTEFSVPIAIIMPTLGKWCDAWLKAPRAMAHFSYFLSTPSGRPLLEWGMVRVADALSEYSEQDWTERDLKEGLTAAVQACAKYVTQQQFNTSPNLKLAFETVLGRLSSLLIPAAIQLRDEIGH